MWGHIRHIQPVKRFGLSFSRFQQLCGDGFLCSVTDIPKRHPLLASNDTRSKVRISSLCTLMYVYDHLVCSLQSKPVTVFKFCLKMKCRLTCWCWTQLSTIPRPHPQHPDPWTAGWRSARDLWNISTVTSVIAVTWRVTGKAAHLAIHIRLPSSKVN